MVVTYTLLEVGGEIIDTKEYFDVQMFSSINQTLPKLTFKLRDIKGEFWKRLSFSIGSTVRVYYTDRQNEKSEGEMLPTCPFTITKMFNGYEYKNEFMGGYVQVWAEQSWRFYGDYTAHAYPEKKMSELIKDVCKDSAKQGADGSSGSLTGLIVKDENFENSTDTGSIRYKTAISDIDFLEQKILPITMIDSSNVLFYVDKLGIVHLTSFSKLYNKKEKVCLHQDMEDSGEEEKLIQAIENKDIKDHSSILRMSTTIGDSPKCVDELNSRLYLYNNLTGKTFIGNQTLSVSSGKNIGDVYKTYTPVKTNITDGASSPTSTTYYANRSFEDQVALARNNLIATNDIFSTTVEFPNMITNLNVGDTIFLWTPNLTNYEEKANGKVESSERKVHWLSGKWLVANEALITVSTSTVVTKLKLIRPTFYFNKNRTSLADYKSFYRID